METGSIGGDRKMAENPKESDSIIHIDGLRKSFGPRTVLKDITFSIPRGKTTVIIGGSGCGKSTLLKHLVGYLKPDQGRILYDGVDIVPFDDEALGPIRRRFGILFQNGALFNSMTAYRSGSQNNSYDRKNETGTGGIARF